MKIDAITPSSSDHRMCRQHLKGHKGRKTSQISRGTLPDSETECTEAEFRQLFSMFDTDNSGAIGKEELKQAMIRIGVDAHEQDIEDLINEVDEDGNGEIDFAEFCDCLRKSQQRAKKLTKEGLTRQCFEIFDQDGNGVISEAEFKYIAKEIGDFDDELADRVFSELDTCSNGILTQDQFAAVVEDYLFSHDDEFVHTPKQSRSATPNQPSGTSTYDKGTTNHDISSV
ncbi:unnamed protein product [Gongylonema pulchrum]|uniref:Troponin C n=1 Tax=Gongylonema pulchrum TaxID=637853 RepID=A0A183E388_9BILA|nr:unnamed protein product [Gongylonema pulchrum]